MSFVQVINYQTPIRRYDNLQRDALLIQVAGNMQVSIGGWRYWWKMRGVTIDIKDAEVI